MFQTRYPLLAVSLSSIDQKRKQKILDAEKYCRQSFTVATMACVFGSSTEVTATAVHCFYLSCLGSLQDVRSTLHHFHMLIRDIMFSHINFPAGGVLSTWSFLPFLNTCYPGQSIRHFAWKLNRPFNSSREARTWCKSPAWLKKHHFFIL